MNTILLLEDEAALSRGIQFKLEKEGYRVIACDSIREARLQFQANPVRLILCDIMLSDGSGLDFCKYIREELQSDVQFVFLTAMDTELDIVIGYETGADDYITKPFSLMVLVSKVNALMRRIDNAKEYESVMTCGEIEVNCREMKVYKGGEEIALSKKELQLLVYLWENAGRIVSKENILEHIWDVDGQFVDDNTVTVNISRLKNKLGTEEISNVRGLGYIWSGKVIRR